MNINKIKDFIKLITSFIYYSNFYIILIDRAFAQISCLNYHILLDIINSILSTAHQEELIIATSFVFFNKKYEIVQDNSQCYSQGRQIYGVVVKHIDSDGVAIDKNSNNMLVAVNQLKMYKKNDYLKRLFIFLNRDLYHFFFFYTFASTKSGELAKGPFSRAILTSEPLFIIVFYAALL